MVVIIAASRGLFSLRLVTSGKVGSECSANTFFAVAGKHIIPPRPDISDQVCGGRAAIFQYSPCSTTFIKSVRPPEAVRRSTCFLFEHASRPSRLQGKKLSGLYSAPPAGGPCHVIGLQVQGTALNTHGFQGKAEKELVVAGNHGRRNPACVQYRLKACLSCKTVGRAEDRRSAAFRFLLRLRFNGTKPICSPPAKRAWGFRLRNSIIPKTVIPVSQFLKKRVCQCGESNSILVCFIEKSFR